MTNHQRVEFARHVRIIVLHYDLKAERDGVIKPNIGGIRIAIRHQRFVGLKTPRTIWMPLIGSAR